MLWVTVDVFCFFSLLTCYPQVLPLVSNSVYALVITLHHFFHHFFRMCRHALLFNPAFCLNCKTRKQPSVITSWPLHFWIQRVPRSPLMQTKELWLFPFIGLCGDDVHGHPFVVWLHFFLSHSVTKSYVETYHSVPWMCACKPSRLTRKSSFFKIFRWKLRMYSHVCQLRNSVPWAEIGWNCLAKECEFILHNSKCLLQRRWTCCICMSEIWIFLYLFWKSVNGRWEFSECWYDSRLTAVQVAAEDKGICWAVCLCMLASKITSERSDGYWTQSISLV